MDFSVAMCTYYGDRAEWLRSAVNSVVRQTVPPSEIVLVVDGPVPESLDDLIRTYEADPLFCVVRLKENSGQGNARRVGLKQCKYELVAIMDADDVARPDRFEKQLKVFSEDETLDIVGGQIREFAEDPAKPVSERIVPESDAEIKRYMKKRCPMNLVSVMFRRQSVERAGGFVGWYCEEDYYLWLRMAEEGMRFANVPDVLVDVRVGKEMYARRGGMKYFRSEKKLQKYMYQKGMIGFFVYASNVAKRWIVQVLMPNRVRGWVFRKFARKKAEPK